MLVGKQVKLAARRWPWRNRSQHLKNIVRGSSTGVFEMKERRPSSAEVSQSGSRGGQALYEEMKAASKGEATKKKTAPVNRWVSGSGEELRSVSCKIGGVHVEAVLDSGADQYVMCTRFVEKLEAVGVWMTSRALVKEVELAGFQEGFWVHISREVKVDLDVSTFAGKLLLKNVACWVAVAPLAAGLGEIWVYRREVL
jgi:hypothetical protein